MSHQPTSLSDDQRRTVCRIAFLFLCVLPTAAMLYCIFHRPGPEDWAQMIRAELGFRIEIESIATPTPSITLLRGVRILQSDDEESSLQQLKHRKIEELAIVFGENTNQIIVMDPIESNISTLTDLVSELSRQLGKTLNIGNEWRVRFKKVTLFDSELDHPEMVFQPIDIFVEPTLLQDEAGVMQEAVHVTVQTQIPGQTTDTKLLAQIWSTKNYTAVTFDSGVDRLPIYLARSWLSQLDQLGAQCLFNGKFKFWFPNSDPNLITGTIAGNLFNIQLDQITGLPGNGLTGSCNVVDLNCNLDQGRIESAQLQVSANGAISADRAWVDVVRTFSNHSTEPVAAQRISIANLDFGLRVIDGIVHISNSQTHPIRIPVQAVAMAFAGERSLGTLSIAISNLFKIPAERIARAPANDDTF